jgi:hypothetical protein
MSEPELDFKTIAALADEMAKSQGHEIRGKFRITPHGMSLDFDSSNVGMFFHKIERVGLYVAAAHRLHYADKILEKA